MQDVAPPPKQAMPQLSTVEDNTPIQPEIVSDLPVKVQNTSSSQIRAGTGSHIASKPIPDSLPAGRNAGQDNKELDKVPKNVNRKVKADDNKPPKAGIFKRWESVLVTVTALAVAAALCLAAIYAFKTR